MSGEREIIQLLDARRSGVDPDGAAVLRILEREVECFRTSIDDHAVWWNADAWCDAPDWSDLARGHLRDLTEFVRQRHASGPQWTLISRRDVFDRAANLDVFLATMAWGFGDRGYGCRRTADVIRDAGGEDRVSSAIDALRTAYERDGAIGVWQAWSGRGRAKLRGVGTAFASKLAYFACFDATQEAGPLIADDNTAWGLWALADISDSLRNADRYQRYVAWAEARARDLGCRPDDIERALFTIGPDVKQNWRRLGM